MESGIGAKLREARKRRKIELSEVEAATKIRGAYLRAIEAEDWDALPGDAYARGFVRTYAAYLGLDGARLAETVPARSPPPPPGAGGGAGRSRRGSVAAVCALLLGAIVAIGIVWGGGGGGGPSSPEPTGAGGVPVQGTNGPPPRPPSPAPGRGAEGPMTVSLTAAAEVWVCLLNEQGKPLVDGIVLPPGAQEGPFRSGSFTVSFGNGEVEMRIDGSNTQIPESASPLGYAIARGGRLSALTEAERPTCT